MILETHRRRMRQLLGQQPDLTLAELRGALGLHCTLPAIHYALGRMNLTYKKRLCAPANNSGRT